MIQDVYFDEKTLPAKFLFFPKKVFYLTPFTDINRGVARVCGTRGKKQNVDPLTNCVAKSDKQKNSHVINVLKLTNQGHIENCMF